MAAARIDRLQQRARRQKTFVVVGGILLLLVFAFEAKTFGLLGGGDSSTPAATTATTAATTTAPASAPTRLPDTEVAPEAAGGTLASFAQLETKNPFAPQVRATSTQAAPATPAPVTTTTAATPAAAPATPVPARTTAAAAASSIVVTPARTTTAATARATAEIAVNGRSERVAEAAAFPAAAPVFRLVGVGHGTASVAVVGGTYQSGDATLALQQRKPVTLMNTSDGKRYRLELLRTP